MQEFFLLFLDPWLVSFGFICVCWGIMRGVGCRSRAESNRVNCCPLENLYRTLIPFSKVSVHVLM